MTKKNYAAWHIDPSDFPEDGSDLEKLKFFVRYAVLAPSGHNTQPWRFSTDKQALLLSADYDRRLPYSGVQANEPMVSLGTCLETLRLAAKGFGYEVKIKYVLRGEIVATVALANKTTSDPSLLEAIVNRSSNRNPYDSDTLPNKLLENFVKTDLEHVSTQISSSRQDIEYIAKETTEGTLRTFSDKEFRTELSKWVRNNLTKQHDGMPGYTQDIPTPPSLLAKYIIKRLDVSKDQAKKDTKRVRQSPHLIILSADQDSAEALLNSGRLYAQICILAQQKGIATAGVGAAVVDPTARTEVKRQFKLPGRPVAIIRIGRAQKPARHTPRWPFTAVFTD